MPSGVALLAAGRDSPAPVTDKPVHLDACQEIAFCAATDAVHEIAPQRC
jgi:hypothetical protein